MFGIKARADAVKGGASPSLDSPRASLLRCLDPVFVYTWHKLGWRWLPAEAPPLIAFLWWPPRIVRRFWFLRVAVPRLRARQQAEAAGLEAEPPAKPYVAREPRVRRVAIFRRCLNRFEDNHVNGLRSGFERMGIEVFSRPWLLDGAALDNFVKEFAPEFVFEINRSRRHIRDYDGKIHHIAWVQDSVAHGWWIGEGFGDSDMTYGVVDPELMGLKPGQLKRSGVLAFAVDPDIFRPLGELTPRWDVSTLSYLPPPLTALDLAGRAQCGEVNTTIGEIRAALRGSALGKTDVFGGIQDFLLAFMRAHDPSYEPDDEFRKLLILFDDRVIRHEHRRGVWENVLDVTRNIAIFGNGHWPFDRRFGRYFRGQIFEWADKNVVNCLTKVGCHNGKLAMHERVLELMAAQRPVIINATPQDDLVFGINHNFTPDEDFVAFHGHDADAVLAGSR